MSKEFRNQYKKRPGGFNDTTDGRLVRAGRHEQRRRENRDEQFARNRDVPTEKKDARRSANSELSARLRRWKEERALKKKIEDAKKKPVFKVGVVHHNFYSPVHDKAPTKTRCHPRGGQKDKAQPSPQKRITRATQKRLQAKNLASAANTIPKVSPRPARVQQKRVSSTKAVLDESLAPRNYAFTAPKGIKAIPMFGRVRISEMSKDDSLSNSSEFNLKTALAKPWPTVDSTKNNAGQLRRTRRESKSRIATECSSDASSPPIENPNPSTNFSSPLSSESGSSGEPAAKEDPPLANADDTCNATPPRSGSPVPASFSPFIVTSRGKDSARKEQKNRMGIRRSTTNEIPTKETVMENLNISVEEEEQTAQYFKFLLQRETDRLNGLCDKWDASRTDPNLSEDAASQIVSAIGQTKLLMRKKFERFRSLIHDCETGKGQMLVRCKDLGGFWDLIDREIKDCDGRFLKLDYLKAHDWIEEETAVVRKVAKKNPAPARPKINVQSSARSWILAARKKKMAQEAGLVVEEFVGAAPSTSLTSKSPKEPERRRRTSTPQTPMSLLKKVQLSEASKDVTSPLAVMKVSKMFKTPEVTMDDTISYVNSDQTPARGILKKSEESSGSESCPPRSSRKVDFNDDVFLEEVPAAEVDEALQNSLDLGRALARIDSYDSDDSDDPSDSMPNVTKRTAEKRLDFENESFDEPEKSHTAESAAVEAAQPEACLIPSINIIISTPTIATTKNVPSKNSKLLDVPAVVTNEEPVHTRVLRNRMVTPQFGEKVTPGRKRRLTRQEAVESSPTGSSRITRSHDATETNSHSSSTKENADPQKKTASEVSNVLGTDRDNEDQKTRRRSTRKSVRFNPDDCTACGEAPKPVQPMTPHARRSRKVSLLGDRPSESSVGPLIGGDLMSFDTPAKIPARIRRSSCK